MVRGGRDDPFSGSGRGAIAGCHCRVPFQYAMVVEVVPLLGAIAIAICHCNVLWWGARVTTILGRVDVVPLLGANLCFICSFYFQGHQFHPDTQENGNEFCLELLADVTLSSTLITQNLVFAIWGLC